MFANIIKALVSSGANEITTVVRDISAIIRTRCLFNRFGTVLGGRKYLGVSLRYG